MKNINLYIALSVLLLLAGCDYNEEHFSGYDSGLITDVVAFSGDFTGTYPDEGYFTDRDELTTAVDKMLKGVYFYNDKNSTAKVTVLFGDIIPGFSQANEEYELKAADYDSMGEDNGQPGKFNNFDSSMDVEGYLIDFVAKKYADMKEGSIVTIYYVYYITGSNKPTLAMSFKREVYGWDKYILDEFAADYFYTLTAADYTSMGSGDNEPGANGYFTKDMPVDAYISSFLHTTYPYAIAEKTATVTYNYFDKDKQEAKTSTYKYDGTKWNFYDPYAPVIAVTSKIADMKYDGNDWKLNLLIGGSVDVKIGKPELQILVDWVKNNKYEYWQDEFNEFYYGAGSKYGNVNNNYDNWRNSANDPHGEYSALSDDALQTLMDERIAEGFATHVLPALYPSPDPELSYDLTYNIYRGNRAGDNVMSFMYNKETGVFDLVAGPEKKK